MQNRFIRIMTRMVIAVSVVMLIVNTSWFIFPYSNFVTLILLDTIGITLIVSMAIGTFILNVALAEEQEKHRTLIVDKDQQNRALEEQNEEINAQREEFLLTQEQLSQALQTIEQQKASLMLDNTSLQESLQEKNKGLQEANRELQKYNGELRQFSYTISHNLRAPIARLLGLGNLIELENEGLSDTNANVLRLIRSSSHELDSIIKDLNKIIDIRNELYSLKEKVYFQDEWLGIYKSLESQISSDMTIETDFSHASFIYTVRPLLNSILYNLASNAIKYQSPQRKLHLKISTTHTNGAVTLQVSDNGLGMNLDQFGKEVFGMYKRFHTHIEGKGLGLYLVKTQAETLGGEIRITSKPNVGTTFMIDFKIPVNIEGQICFENDSAVILYNARMNIMGLSWKREASSDQYRFILSTCLEMLHVYKTALWIADLRRQGRIEAADRLWMIEKILVEAAHHNLKCITCIYDPNLHSEDDRKALATTAAKVGVLMMFFSSRREAESWIDEKIKRFSTQEKTV